MEKILEYLDNVISLTSGKQKEYYRFLRDNGKAFTNREDANKSFDMRKVKIKDCFNQSVLYSLQTGAYYYEGLYLPKGLFPMEHAFNVKDDELIDVVVQKFGFEIDCWFGIHIPREEVERHIRKVDSYFPMLSNYYFSKQEIHVQKEEINNS